MKSPKARKVKAVKAYAVISEYTNEIQCLVDFNNPSGNELMIYRSLEDLEEDQNQYLGKVIPVLITPITKEKKK